MRPRFAFPCPYPGACIILCAAVLLSTSGLTGQESGPVRLSLADLSADLQIGIGGSSVDDDSLLLLQGGHHDPRKRGFTFQGLELGMQGAIDPYLSLQAALHYTIDAATNESHFEMVEAFLTSSQLPGNLHEKGVHLEAGQMLTEFGRHNPTHLHERSWMDQPVINTRIFGQDGMRGMGLRIGMSDPTTWLSGLHLGIQDASGENMMSFNSSATGETTIGNIAAANNEVKSLEDFVYLLRLEKEIDSFTKEVHWTLGSSGLCGPNSTDDGGRTVVLGADITMKWVPEESENGWPFLIWQTEIMRRRFMLGTVGDGAGAPFSVGDGGSPDNDDTLMDWGFYSQVLWGYKENLAIGLRYEFASGQGSTPSGRLPLDATDPYDSAQDPFRDNRQRISPVWIWTPTENSRFRLQYNYDLADHLEESQAHSIWVGMEIHFGAHTANPH